MIKFIVVATWFTSQGGFMKEIVDFDLTGQDCVDFLEVNTNDFRVEGKGLACQIDSGDWKHITESGK